MEEREEELSTLENGLGIGVADFDVEAADESELVDIVFLIASRVAEAAFDAEVDALELRASRRLLVGTPLRVMAAGLQE